MGGPDPPRRALLALAVASVAALAGAELVLRARDFDPLGEAIDADRLRVLRPSDVPLLDYEFVPNSRGRIWDADIAINSHGFRDDEWETAKRPGTFRIVALGDSVTFGTKLPQDATWPAQLEKALEGREPPVEVLNLGSTGYDLMQEVALLEARGLAYDPDLVVVAYHVNDAGRVSPAAGVVERMATYDHPIYRLRLAQFLRYHLDRIELREEAEDADSEELFVERNAALIDDVRDDAELEELVAELERHLATLGPAVEPGAVPSRAFLHRYLGWYTSRPRIGKLRHAFGRLAKLAQRGDFEVLVVFLPWLEETGAEQAYELVYAIAEHEAVRAGLTTLQVFPATRAFGHARLKIGGLDSGHPNRAGHRIVAREILTRLERRGWPEQPLRGE